jgi:hypothetical protein
MHERLVCPAREGSDVNSDGRFARSVAMITHSRVVGSCLISGITSTTYAKKGQGGLFQKESLSPGVQGAFLGFSSPVGSGKIKSGLLFERFETEGAADQNERLLVFYPEAGIVC